MIDFDATSLSPSTMYDEKSVYLKIESGFAFKLHMNDVSEVTNNIQTFNHDGNESATLWSKSYNPLDFYFNIYWLKKKLKILK